MCGKGVIMIGGFWFCDVWELRPLNDQALWLQSRGVRGPGPVWSLPSGYVGSVWSLPFCALLCRIMVITVFSDIAMP